MGAYGTYARQQWLAPSKVAGPGESAGTVKSGWHGRKWLAPAKVAGPGESGWPR